MDLILENICKSFGNLIVLDDFSVVFKEGGIYAIMGDSGKGKTSLLNIIMGLLKPDSGYIKTKDNIRFSVVFQEDRLCEGMDAFGNVGLVLGRDITKEYIINELKAAGIEEAVKKPVMEFSGGMKRRVAIVRAVLADSDILVLDEAFKGLNVELRKVMIAYVKERIRGRMVIMVTHDVEDAIDFGAEVIML